MQQRPVHEPIAPLLLQHTSLATRQASTSTATAAGAADFYISHLPGLPQSTRLRLYAGHLSAVTSTTATSEAASDAHLFFLLAKAKHIADRQRLIIWFNGGPGCSSFDGALMEVGPVRMHPEQPGQLVEAPYPWNEYANVLFVDQPAGTGYSYISSGQPVTELAPAADQVVNFLTSFYRVFPEYETMDTYLAGESYAGQYIPYIADAILKTKLVATPLRGLLMGNAWLDPAIQYPAYLDLSFQLGLITKGSSDAQRAEDAMASCNETLSTSGKGRVLVPDCENLLWAVLPPPSAANECVNVYNTEILEPCGSEYPPDIDRVQPYLRTPSVVDAFHATAKTVPWVQCNNTISDEMWSPASRPSIELLPGIIDQGVEVLLFAGELDMMCNWLGVERSIEHMTWQGATGLNATAREWHVNGTQTGTWASARGVHWVRIHNASHMVPIEQPMAAQDLFLRFANVSKLDATGRASRLASSLGREVTSVLGLTTPDGHSIVSSNTSKTGTAGPPGLAVPGVAANGTTVELSEEELEANEQLREAYYGPRRSIVLVVLLVVLLLAIALLLRWQQTKRRRRRSQRFSQPARRSSVADDDAAMYEAVELEDEEPKRSSEA